MKGIKEKKEQDSRITISRTDAQDTWLSYLQKETRFLTVILKKWAYEKVEIFT